MTDERINSLKIALLYFVEEALGYRHSLHWLRRYFETKDIADLENLLRQVLIENFHDADQFLSAAKGVEDYSRWNVIETLIAKGFNIPNGWLKEDLSNKGLRVLSGPVSYMKLLRANVELSFEEVSALRLEYYQWYKDTADRLDEYVDIYGILTVIMQQLVMSKFNMVESVRVIEALSGETAANCVLPENLNNFTLLVEVISQYFPEANQELHNLVNAIVAAPDGRWEDALSRNQIKSKVWLLEKLFETSRYRNTTITKGIHEAVLPGGWFGMLPYLANLKYKKQVKNIKFLNVELDSQTVSPSKELNSDPKLFNTIIGDIRDFKFINKNAILIDTIVEHFDDHGSWISSLPIGTMCVLQGNDMFDEPDHVNCHESLEEFVSCCGLSKIFYQGELTLPNCNRYMVIGEV